MRLVGVQAAACAPLAGGQERGFTIAEGIWVKKPGDLTTAIIREASAWSNDSPKLTSSGSRVPAAGEDRRHR